MGPEGAPRLDVADVGLGREDTAQQQRRARVEARHLSGSKTRLMSLINAQVQRRSGGDDARE